MLAICGKKRSADSFSAVCFIKDFKGFMEKESFVTDQTYNINETGLNFKMLTMALS